MLDGFHGALIVGLVLAGSWALFEMGLADEAKKRAKKSAACCQQSEQRAADVGFRLRELEEEVCEWQREAQNAEASARSADQFSAAEICKRVEIEDRLTASAERNQRLVAELFDANKEAKSLGDRVVAANQRWQDCKDALATEIRLHNECAKEAHAATTERDRLRSALTTIAGAVVQADTIED